MTSQQIRECREQLASRFPFFGARRQRVAVTRLMHDSSADAVPLLVEALRVPDDLARAGARAALLNLKRPDAVDALCSAWATHRDADLGAMVSQRQYVAAKPVDVRVLSALKASQPALAVADAASVPFAVTAVGDRDADIARAAGVALRQITAQPAIDAVCGLWAKERTPALAAIVAEGGYVASQPVEVRVLSALKVNRLEASIENASAVSVLAAALRDADATIVARAEQVTRAAANRAIVDAMCALAATQPTGRLATICVETGKRPSDPDEACLFLVVTKQLDAYAKEDFEFQHLRPAYERASPEVRAHVMDVYRTGDVRLRGFIGGMRAKPLTDCSASEIAHFVDLHVRRQEWSNLFKGFLDLPLEYGLPLLDHFRASKWEPEEPELRSLLRQALADTGGVPAPPKKSDATSTVFERWLHEGSQTKGSEAELLSKLATATPPEGVKLVAALAASGQVSEQAANAVRTSPHWLIRLAGYAVGLPMQLDQSSEQDPNYWVRELAQAEGVLKLWPPKATPADLDRMDQAPAEAGVGRLGAARRVLRLLIARRITAPDAEVMTIDAGAESGEFERA